MNKQYKVLFDSMTLNRGQSLVNRFAMSPMVAAGSTYAGEVQDDDVQYFLRRANTAGLLITGAANVGPYGNAFGYGLSANADSQIPGLKRLAEAMKSKGNKAILQIFHPGRQAKYSYQDEGVAYGPSSKQFEFLDYPVKGLTTEEIYEYVDFFAQATKRAIEAGFDGVEVHGANHYLIQQFFSSLSNERPDEWGGDLTGRSAFAIAIVKAVQEQVKANGRSDFIIGYRISPEEIHGETVGYDLDESLYLIDQIVSLGVDYIHTSHFGPSAYKAVARRGEHQGKIVNEVIRQLIDGRTLLMVAGDITSADKALDALNYADLLAMGTLAIVEPDFVQKLQSGQEDLVNLNFEGRVEDLALPKRFYMMANALRSNQSILSESVDYLVDTLKNNHTDE
ncbi:NADH-dependent flavin oxidoreductase [Aerococcaceae bacterium WGS1372]